MVIMEVNLRSNFAKPSITPFAKFLKKSAIKGNNSMVNLDQYAYDTFSLIIVFTPA